MGPPCALCRFSTSTIGALVDMRSKGILGVFAAGNDGSQQAFYPASYNLDNIVAGAPLPESVNRAVQERRACQLPFLVV